MINSACLVHCQINNKNNGNTNTILLLNTICWKYRVNKIFATTLNKMLHHVDGYAERGAALVAHLCYNVLVCVVILPIKYCSRLPRVRTRQISRAAVTLLLVRFMLA